MKLRPLILLFAAILLFSSCSHNDAEISHIKGTEAIETVPENSLRLYVNVSAKKIHYNETCRYLLQANEENIVTMEYTEKTLQTLISMEYVSCHNCK